MITSLSNPTIKHIRKLRERKERQQSSLFLAEGVRLVGEADQLDARIEMLLVAPDLLRSDFGWQIVDHQKGQGVTVLEVSDQVFKSISIKEGPQGIAAVVHQQWFTLSELTPDTGVSWVALDAVQDPGNLGTILRTSAAVGGCGLILLDQTADPYDPTSVRASMGAIFSQKLVKTSLAEFSLWRNVADLPVIGTSGIATTDYQSIEYPPALILLMGSERQGLQQNHLDLCNLVVRIPMVGRVDSLNLSVATALVLYEIFNQRRTHSTNPNGI